MTANYTLLSLTMDRVIAVWKPQFYREKLKPRVARKVATGVGLLFCFLCAPVYFFAGLVGDDCFLGSEAASMGWLLPPWIIDTYKQIMSSIFLVAVPFVMLLILNSFIVYKLKKSGGTINKNEREVTISLMMICLFYLTMNIATTTSSLLASQNEVRNEREVTLRTLLISFSVRLFLFFFTRAQNFHQKGVCKCILSVRLFSQFSWTLERMTYIWFFLV